MRNTIDHFGHFMNINTGGWMKKQEFQKDQFYNCIFYVFVSHVKNSISKFASVCVCVYIFVGIYTVTISWTNSQNAPHYLELNVEMTNIGKTMLMFGNRGLHQFLIIYVPIQNHISRINH